MLFQWQNYVKQAVSLIAEEACSFVVEKSLPPMGGLEILMANTTAQYAALAADRLFDDSVAAFNKLR